MWLLNVSTFELEEYFDNTPRYAILSHRWVSKEELSFADVEELKAVPLPKRCQKIVRFCEEAQKESFTHVWVDTCCIDKKSSAELSEAINSMYKWYKGAAICYVYLNDVAGLADLEKSSWFPRGWTLQELLAPVKIQFFDRDWTLIGSRENLAASIHKITGIPSYALPRFQPANHCIAEKFSWSARRQTTRAEDRAYCLLGLFEVNMPLLYGEGVRSFQRLQEEIMKVSTDMTLFLWQGRGCDTFGMLAADPNCYVDLPRRRLNSVAQEKLYPPRGGWTVNNAGISLEAKIQPYMLTEKAEEIFALHLDEPRSYISGFVIFLRRDAYDTRRGITTLSRATVDGVAIATSTELQAAYVAFGTEVAQLTLTRQPLVHVNSLTGTCAYNVTFKSPIPMDCTAHQRPDSYPDAQLREWHPVDWDHEEVYSLRRKSCFSVSARSAPGLHGYVLITLADDIKILICLGLNGRFEPMCFVMPLCKRICDDGLNTRCILNAYRWNQFGTHQVFNNTNLHMICLCGAAQCLFAETDIGLTLDIAYVRSPHGRYTADIKFDPKKFITYYLPAADTRELIAVTCTSQQNLDKLHKIESDIYLKRLQSFGADIL